MRPLSSTSSTNLTVDSFRIQLSLKTLKFLGLKPGGICQLQWDDEKIELGLAWPAAQAISDGVVQLSGLAQEIFGLKNGDKVQLSQPVRTFPQATSVVYEISSGKDEATGSTSKEEKNGIEWLIRHSLGQSPEERGGCLKNTDIAFSEDQAYMLPVADDCSAS